MGQFDFTTLPDRIATNSMKWKEVQEDQDLLPLWVADMDFLGFPAIHQTLEAFSAYQVYGYPSVSPSLFQAIQDWEKREHGYAIEKDSIVLIEGVVPAISVAIQAFTQENDAVLINTPVYPPFARTVRLNNRQLVTNSLIKANGHFEIDFDQLEKDIVENDVKLYLFCSPHNPGGRVWTKEELLKLGQLCQKYDVILVSDEIHQDMALFGHKHHTINTVSDSFKERSLVLSSATKTFNIAGTKNSFVLIENPKLRKRFKDRQLANNQHEISTLGLLATEAALTEGKAWLEELKAVLEDNINFVVSYFEEYLPQVEVMKPEGTYLIWLDFSGTGLDHLEIGRKLREQAKVILNDGLTFGKEGRYHYRINVAAPAHVIQEGCERIVKAFQ